ncbi:ABC transporter ATP-binding protein [Tateyamaria omphalii]|uniref:ABC transporter ATP-binding protein n=1 Tax=Tateyamaria omphalii TaxID=299262 RepID=A0A1P8MSA4_9RHOB|nr:dipeptide/oligopeptide/nickel ABC transporter ATP-binding protein [Tateyamaria omphalii]APX10892.1 ABC transporter ATP-binding protein [Tateyamaria omphalii]
MLSVDRVWVKRGNATALEDISLSLLPGQTLAVIGESGAGKSTLIGAILGLLRPSKGEITWDGGPIGACRPALVMQEPRAAFNPVLPLRQSVMEPIRAQKARVPDERIKRLCDGLEIPIDLLDRRPGEVSIGQAQRVGILRALISAPPLILFDEPLSALDAVTQKHTGRLISDLQREEGFAALIVTHDLGYAVAHADDIAVLKSGRIEEVAPSRTFALSPKTDYCRALRDAAIALGALGAVG